MPLKSFSLWLIENAHGKIAIDASRFAQTIHQLVDKLRDHYTDRQYTIQNFNLNPTLVNQGTKDYPRQSELMASFGKPNFEAENEAFHNWALNKLKTHQMTPELRTAYYHIQDYADHLSGADRFNLNELDGLEQQIMTKTQANMGIIQKLIEDAINNISFWSNSPITIEPEGHYSVYNPNEMATEPAESAQVTLGERGSFSMFMTDGKMDAIDDVLEGGDEDEYFFGTDAVKADYYALINELRHPGSSSKGKVLTLFTARPTKDREFYEKEQKLLINVFLTNSFSHADGLAHDYGERDIWKVKIDSKYLTQTLDGPIKYYMVSREAPVKMSLY